MGMVVDQQSGGKGGKETCCVSPGSSLMAAMAMTLAMAVVAATKCSEGDTIAPLVTPDPRLYGCMI